MHNFIGACGQVSIDFSGGTFQELTDGVNIPLLYNVLFVALGLLVLGGLIFNRDWIVYSALGRFLRRPLIFPADASSTAQGLGIWELSTLEHIVLTGWIVYFAVGIALSTAAYGVVGRSPTYVLGHTCAIQMAISLIPVARNSPFLWLMGIPFDIAIRCHRISSWLAILLSFIHGLCMVIFWDLSILFSTAATQFGLGSLYGTLSFVAMVVMAIGALDQFRRSNYSRFLAIHISSATLAYLFALLHSSQFRWLLLGPGLIFCFDLAVRFVWSRLQTSRITTIRLIRDPYSRVTVTELTFHRPGFRFQPGSHVYLCLPFLSVTEYHPLSISSAPAHAIEAKEEVQQYHVGADTFTLHILTSADASSWTARLAETAAVYLTQSPAEQEASRNVLFACVVDGPYHSLGSVRPNRFSTVVLVAGGIGITPLASVFADLLATPSVTKIVLVWVARSRTLLKEAFPALLAQASQPNMVDRVFLRLFHDGGGEPMTEVTSEAAQESSVAIVTGRPNVGAILDEVQRAIINPHDVYVSACGPPGLTAMTQKAAGERDMAFAAEGFLF